MVNTDFHVLSLDGGGTKAGFFYFLLELMAKNNINFRPNLLIGTSSGAIFAAFLACGLNKEDKWKQRFKKPLKFFSQFFDDKNDSSTFFSKPVYKGTSKREVLFELFGNKTFKEVSIPLAVVCAELSAQKFIFSSWATPDVKIFEALDASSAAPLFFPPVIVEGVPYMDGGISYTTPILTSYITAMRYIFSAFLQKEKKNKNEISVLSSEEVYGFSENFSNLKNVDHEISDRISKNPVEIPVYRIPAEKKTETSIFEKVLEEHLCKKATEQITGRVNIKIMSLGHNKNFHHTIKFRNPEFASEMGLVNMIRIGVLDNIMYGAFESHLEIMQMLMKKQNILRIDSGLTLMINNCDEDSSKKMEQAAIKSFNQNRELLTRFCSPL